jgi:hypothetical protein
MHCVPVLNDSLRNSEQHCASAAQRGCRHYCANLPITCRDSAVVRLSIGPMDVFRIHGDAGGRGLGASELDPAASVERGLQDVGAFQKPLTPIGT